MVELSPARTWALTPSLGEVQATALRAARGAGYPWGLAQDCGWAARWLWRYGIDGLTPLAAVLETPGPCPVTLGARWMDAPDVPCVAEVRAPVLLIPFLSGRDCHLMAETGAVSLRGGAPVLGALPEIGLQRIEITGQPEAGRPLRIASRRSAPGEVWKRLKRLEARTYAPASDASRAGAGAGLTDND